MIKRLLTAAELKKRNRPPKVGDVYDYMHYYDKDGNKDFWFQLLEVDEIDRDGFIWFKQTTTIPGWENSRYRHRLKRFKLKEFLTYIQIGLCELKYWRI